MRKSYFVGLILTVLFVIACNRSEKKTVSLNNNTSVYKYDSIAGLSGKQLSRLYCSMCHKYPEVSLLTRKMWEKGVLPNMGRRLGIKTSVNPYEGFSMTDAMLMRLAHIYPDKPILPQAAWNKIVEYYMSNAPDSLKPVVYTQKIEDHLKTFAVHEITGSRQTGSMINYIGFNPYNHFIYTGDFSDSLKMLNANGFTENSIKMPSPVTALNFINKDLTLVTCVGILFPNEQAKGRIYTYDNRSDTTLIIKDLQRPVFSEVVDLNQDHKKDIIVCEYGNQTGKLSWFENQGNNRYIKHILVDGPGAIRTQTYDFNGDGRTDIMALFGQGNERIMIFYNKGDGDFESDTPLRFYSVNGSLYFQLVDFNGDGYQDIIYCSGDNADKTNILKPYHGIYIYLNDGHNKFFQYYFFPLYGCIKAIPYDFDNDGDLDIAAISFFPDFSRKPFLGFMYLENISDTETRFKLSTFPENQDGRWLVMDKADYDQDGDMDLIMGSFLFSVSPVLRQQMKRMIDSGVNVMLLENKTENKGFNSKPLTSNRKPGK